MPYVDKEAKAILDAGGGAATVGELTYVIQQKLKRYLEDHHKSYQTLSECLGALEGAKSDLIERVLVPYEQSKQEKNGDVWYDEKGRIV